MTYPVSFRKKILKMKEEEGLSYENIAKRLGMSKTTIFNWSKKLEPQKNRAKKSTKINMNELSEDIEKHPDHYNRERAIRFNVSTTGIRNAIRRLGVTFKKNSKSSKSRSKRKIYILRRD